MSEEQTVTIEVDGREIKAKAGSMLIDVTDAAGINIPRFCYHKKLSVAANCRMCLVEVEKVPKPLPACATPVNEGMKVKTRSPLALAAQKGTMEFLLINHPLDCPICDQGGECELQDIALGYGNDVSRFVEGKRVVRDKDIGPLVATDLTRCIHCTRCVRFGAEIAGIRELGATGRGEHMTIGTYIEKSVDSELSGNIIDICPVGSLTSKPFRFQARAWELVQRESVAPHDSVGSNINLHVRRNKVLRVHPRDNETINECWISDRDRFSYLGIDSEERLAKPRVKRDGQWLDISWSEALELAAEGLKKAGSGLATLVSPTATVEEIFLARQITTGLGSSNIDYRLRQNDFRAEGSGAEWLGLPIVELEQLDTALLIGANPRKDQPILGHRLRKAVLAGATVSYINPFELDLNYRCQQIVVSPAQMVEALAGIAKALGVSNTLADRAEAGKPQQELAEQLKQAGKAVVLLGNLAVSHPDYALLRQLAAEVAQATGAVFGIIPEAANSVGAAQLGALPGEGGKDVSAMIAESQPGYLLIGAEPGRDFGNPGAARRALSGGFTVALSAFRSDCLDEAADLQLPIATFAETSGTFVNAEGRWQSFAGAVAPRGDIRPAWKVLRVLGNLLDLEGFDFNDSTEVLNAAKRVARELDNALTNGGQIDQEIRTSGELVRVGELPLYSADPLVRRSAALQKTRDAIKASVRLSPATADKLGLQAGDLAKVSQNGGQASLPVEIDLTLADGCLRIPTALAGTENLGSQFGEVTLEKA